MIETINKVILDAIVGCDVSPMAKEEAARLVEGWVERFYEEDKKLEIVAVEQPWFYWLNENTLIVGVNDLVGDGWIGEWKTHREPRKRKDGQYYEGEGPQAWRDKMTNGIQLGVYSLRGNRDFLIRAAVKSNPPAYWEHRVKVSDEQVEVVKHALTVQADVIRAARKHRGPWRYPDNHRVYGRMCVCGEPDTISEVPLDVLSVDDPGYAAIVQALGSCDYHKIRELVVLSASAYETSVSCLDAYRKSLLGQIERSEALDIGTAFHLGVGAYYKEIMNERQGSSQ